MTTPTHTKRPRGRPPKHPVGFRGNKPLWGCTRCKKPKPGDSFPPDKQTANGLSSWCRDCHRKYKAAKRAAGGYRYAQ